VKTTILFLVCCAVALHVDCAQKSAAPAPVAAATTYRIAGVIVDATTEAPLAEVQLKAEGHEGQFTAVSDAEGRFVFAGLESGKYRVSATAPGYLDEAYNQHHGYSTAMATGDGLDSEHMHFRLHRQAVITGTVIDERGEVVRGAQVMLFEQIHGGHNRRPDMVGSKTTDDLGAYRFAHLSAGKYLLAVSARPWYAQSSSGAYTQWNKSNGADATDPALDVVYPTTFYPDGTDERSAAELTAVAGEAQQADVRLRAIPSIHIRVSNLPLDENGQARIGIVPIQRVFGVYPSAVHSNAVQVSPGVYEVTGLVPGEVMLSISEQHDGKWSQRSIRTTTNGGESVDAGTNNAEIHVSGTAVGASPGASIWLRDESGANPWTEVQKDGSFSFSNVSPGVYHVGINSRDRYVLDVSATGARASGDAVTLETGQDAQLLVHVGSGYGHVKGVVNAEGKPEAGVMVLIVPAAVEDTRWDSRMDQSDSDGTFELRNIIPGKYILLAIENGWDLDWHDPEVLRPYREKGQAIEIASSQERNVKIQRQKLLAPKQEKEIPQ
jgi:hypothetical protein